MHKKKLVKNIETENFSVPIGRVSIEYQSSQAKVSLKNLKIFDWSKNRFNRSKTLKKKKKKRFYWSTTNRITIEQGQELAFKNFQFSTDWKSHSINRNSGKLNFLKNCRRLCKNYSNQGISWMKCMRMSLNVFQKHEFSIQNFKTRFLIIKNTIFANP